MHSYEQIDWEIVFALTGEPLDDFERFAGCMVAALNQGDPPPAEP